MLPKDNRFTFKSRLPKKLLNFQSFSLKFDRNDEGLKVGVVVSKKVDKRAVIRNKIKRKVISVVEDNLNKQEPLTLIFYIKKGFSFDIVESEVLAAVTKVKE